VEARPASRGGSLALSPFRHREWNAALRAAGLEHRSVCALRRGAVRASSPMRAEVTTVTAPSGRALALVTRGWSGYCTPGSASPLSATDEELLAALAAARGRQDLDAATLPRHSADPQTHKGADTRSAPLVGAVRFELTTSRPPAGRANQAALRPEMLLPTSHRTSHGPSYVLRFRLPEPHSKRVSLIPQTSALTRLRHAPWRPQP
jgi:hypothetical protein